MLVVGKPVKSAGLILKVIEFVDWSRVILVAVKAMGVQLGKSASAWTGNSKNRRKEKIKAENFFIFGLCTYYHREQIICQAPENQFTGFIRV